MSNLTDNSYINAAKKIGCKVRMVKAVDFVESRGSGFLPNGEIKILFEPHIFWKELKKRGITPVVSDICYPVWGTKPYGKNSTQHSRLQKAVLIHREAALCSASWGRFQILGMNYKESGCTDVQEFINRMLEGESEQLDLFTNYIISTHLDDEMREEDCKGFARGYNGPLYYKNSYDTKIKKALLQF